MPALDRGPFLLALAGLTCSGKSLFGSAAEARGALVVSTAPFVDVFLRTDEFMAHLKDKVEAAGKEFVLVDSVHDTSQLDSIAGAHPHVMLACLHCDAREREIRYEARRRRRPTDEEFVPRDKREISQGMGDLYCRAWRILDNSGMTHVEFRAGAERVLLEWQIACLTKGATTTRWKKEERLICFPQYGDGKA